MWVGTVVENQKAGIDAKPLTVDIDINRVRVSTKVGAGFVQRNFMTITRQLPSGRESGNTGTNDCDLHIES